MDEMEFRILETLSQDPGERLSIRALNQEIHRRHGTAHYANTYRTLRRIQREGVVVLTEAGRARLVSLHLDNPIAIDALSEVEIWKRRAVLREHPRLQPMVDALAELPFPAPACLVDLPRNRALDRAEVLAVSPAWASVRQATAALSPRLRDQEEALGIRIDVLILSEGDFVALMAAAGRNPVREMLSRRIVLLGPDLLWRRLRGVAAGGAPIRFDREETNPAKVSDGDIAQSLSRFGYREFGRRTEGGADLGIELLSVAVLLREDARHLNALPTLLRRHPPNYPLLVFLSRKYGVAGGLRKVLMTLGVSPREPGPRDALRRLETDLALGRDEGGAR
jgi:hypothetical protein